MTRLATTIIPLGMIACLLIGCKKDKFEDEDENAPIFAFGGQSRTKETKSTQPSFPQQNYNPSGMMAPNQSNNPWGQPTQANNGGWSTLTHSAGRFQASFPPGNVREQSLDIPVETITLKLTMYGFETQKHAYWVSFSDYPRNIVASQTNDQLSSAVVKGIIQGMKAQKTSERRIEVEGYPAKEVSFRIETGSGKARVLLVDNRLYQLIAFDSPSNRGNFDQFLDSFRLTNGGENTSPYQPPPKGNPSYQPPMYPGGNSNGPNYPTTPMYPRNPNDPSANGPKYPSNPMYPRNQGNPSDNAPKYPSSPMYPRNPNDKGSNFPNFPMNPNETGFPKGGPPNMPKNPPNFPKIGPPSSRGNPSDGTDGKPVRK